MLPKSNKTLIWKITLSLPRVLSWSEICFPLQEVEFSRNAFPLQEFHSKSKFRMKIFINKKVSNLNEIFYPLTTC